MFNFIIIAPSSLASSLETEKSMGRASMEKLKTAEQKASTLENELKNLQMIVQDQENQIKTERNDLQKDLLDQKSIVAQKDITISEMKTDLDEAVHQIHRLSQACTLDVSHFEKLEQEKLETESRVSTLQSGIFHTSYTLELASKDNLLKQLVIDLESSEASLSDTRSRLRDIGLEKDEAAKRNNELHTIQQETEGQLQILKGQLLDSQMTREELSFKLEKLQHDLQTAEERILEHQNEAHIKVEKIESTVNDLKNANMMLLQEKDELISSVRDQSEKLRHAQENMTALESKDRISEQRISQLCLEINSSEKTKEVMMDEKDQLLKHMNTKEAEHCERICEHHSLTTKQRFFRVL